MRALLPVIALTLSIATPAIAQPVISSVAVPPSGPGGQMCGPSKAV